MVVLMRDIVRWRTLLAFGLLLAATQLPRSMASAPDDVRCRDRGRALQFPPSGSASRPLRLEIRLEATTVHGFIIGTDVDVGCRSAAVVWSRLRSNRRPAALHLNVQLCGPPFVHAASSLRQ
jgi:hypothetical protein